MTYLIKHPVVRYTPKFAIAWKNSNFGLSAGIGTFTLQLDSITQSTGMNLTVTANKLILQKKKYVIYYKLGMQNGAESRGGVVTIYKNGVALTSSTSIQAITRELSTTQAGTISPINVASCIIDANLNDEITFLYSRTFGSSLGDTVYFDQTKAIIMEIGE